jgi:hypothetical protein
LSFGIGVGVSRRQFVNGVQVTRAAGAVTSVRAISNFGVQRTGLGPELDSGRSQESSPVMMVNPGAEYDSAFAGLSVITKSSRGATGLPSAVRLLPERRPGA